jgi:hypothetical protein
MMLALRSATAFLFLLSTAAAASPPSFRISYSSGAAPGPLDGRLILIVAADEGEEPRFQVGWGKDTAQIYGVDVEDWRPGVVVEIDGDVPGHPLDHTSELDAGSYHVQAVLNVYETFERADGHTVSLPADDGEGQHWNRSPGNLYSPAREEEIGPGASIEVKLTEVVPPIEPAPDTRYVRHFSMRSELLSAFWGAPVELRAIVLVPEGYDEDPGARYPVAYQQGHFPSDVWFFRETPPVPDAEGDGRRLQSSSYEFYQHWVAGRLPRMLVVLTQHATPYYDDSYGVDSANTGPYGRALTEEFYPALEREFRAIGEPWARVLFGGSTGGWISLAQQVFYPDFFAGAWAFCPDPVDFHAFQLLDVYDENANAFYDRGPFKQVELPSARAGDGRVFLTTREFTMQEHVLGIHGRSGGQLDAFHALFGPVGANGYPKPLWDPLTGEVDRDVARHWVENYDLTAILRRDWKTLGPRLVGKLHVTMGTKDTFYLDGAVRLLEEFLEGTRYPGKGPYYGGSVTWGDNEPHCYTGTPEGLNMVRYHLGVFAEHMAKMAPDGADTSSWR